MVVASFKAFMVHSGILPASRTTQRNLVNCSTVSNQSSMSSIPSRPSEVVSV